MSTYALSPAEVQAIWQQMCAELQPQLTKAVFNTWILSNPLSELVLEGDDKVLAIFTSPTAFHVNNIRKLLGTQLKQTLDKILEKDTLIDFKIGTPQVPRQHEPQASSFTSLGAHLGQPSSAPLGSSLHSAEQAGHHPPQPTSTTFSPSSRLQSPGIGASHSLDNAFPSASSPHFPSQPSPRMSSSSPRVEDLFSPQTMYSVALDRAVVVARQVGLRTDYTFETFAVSTTNEMAHAAATAVSNRPGHTYNPLFLYGGVGVGKTHLMHAIGNNILKNNPDTRVLYCTGEEFTNEIVSAIQNKKAIKFKEKYRTAQVMLIDDIQFIAGKNAVQEEFFHTFNALTKQASQIVLTSDRPPHEINLLEDRLRSRFEAGLMIDIQQPSFELRTAILLIKAQAHNISIPMELAQVVASRVDSARKIEGFITSIKSEVELKKRPITLELIDEILKTEGEKKRPALKVSPNDVLRAVANHYHVKQAALKGSQRVQHLVKARHVAMFLLREDLKLPLTETARWFSNRDHTSVIHAVKKISLSLAEDELMRRDISALRMSLTAVSR
ncbi:MAG TPA: chromosomal replication initiator protein DnaA [Vitreimonas sp.]|nr:chromosomal replication initiator protein DnaA [Vitreimonas sp.]